MFGKMLKFGDYSSSKTQIEIAFSIIITINHIQLHVLNWNPNVM